MWAVAAGQLRADSNRSATALEVTYGSCYLARLRMAAGKGEPGHPRRKAQRYEAYVEKHLRDHMFKNGA